MSTHDIDNDEALFQFDPFDARQSWLVPSSPQLWDTGHPAGNIPPSMSTTISSYSSDIVVDGVGLPNSMKGKSRTMPMPIPPSTIVRDLFDTSSQNPSSPLSYSTYNSSSSSTSNFSSDFSGLYHHDKECMDQSPALSLNTHGKGKKKASFPMLPPLTFTAIDLDHIPGPSSLCSPGVTNQGLPATADISIPSPSLFHSQEAGVLVSRAPVNRSRSLTDLSHQLSPPSLGNVSSTITSQSTLGPSGIPSNISRQLLEILEKKDKTKVLDLSTIDVTSLISTLDLQAIPREPDSYPPAWYTAAKVSEATRSPSPRDFFKAKCRSRSSPFPISAFDIIPFASTDVFQPLPIVVPNYFDLFLPRELRIHIFCTLVDLHDDDYQRSILDGRLTMAKAISSRGRWVGRDRGIRELFKFSRVSKSWQTLIFDGQLWANLDLHSFPGLPQETITRIVQSTGSFVQNLNFAGHVHLVPETMAYVTNDLCLKNPNSPLSYNQLTSVNFQGCVSITTRSLHQLLVRSRALENMSVKGLGVVTNTTCDIISNFCPNLTSLNMSRCANMDAEGIKSLAMSALRRRDHLKLKELRLSGLKNVTDQMMCELGQAAPFLEILDLGYSRQLHNSAIEAFVACDDPCQDLGVNTVLVTARDLGRETGDSGNKLIRRRVTRLRHLVLSHCTMLTDNACANLAYSMPKLEFLELAGIGPDLRDAGLVRLLQQTPLIQRLDLEDASDITDAVIRTITPAQEDAGTTTPTSKPKQPGHILQQLNISYGANLSDGALLCLIRNCKHLTVLEADNSRIGKNVLKEFVRLNRERKALNARIVTIDCRGINESLVKELSPMTRPRLGFRRYDARKLIYLDTRDDNEDEMKVGQDECDEERVVIKTFYSWQTVDAVKAIRDKRKKAAGRKMGSESSNGAGSDTEGAGGIGGSGRRKLGYAKWWSPSTRRTPRSGTTSGTASPILPEANGSDGCAIM